MKSSFKLENGEAIVWVNKDIYSKDVILQATYVMLDQYYFMVDEEEKYYVITISLREEEYTDEKLTKAVYEFFDELIESFNYIEQLKRTSKLRETILERALLTQDSPHKTYKNDSKDE